MSSVKHSQVVEKENHSCQQLCELSETEASQDASKKTSHIWSSFVEQVESMCVSTSLMILGANFRDLPGIIVGADNGVQRDLTVEPILMPSGKPLVPDYAINFCDGKSTRPFSRLWWDETVPTLLCRPDLHSQSILHPEQDRVLTIRECARLQGFPDYYEFCGSVKERYCQVGNAVAIPVARALGFALGMAVRKLTGDEPIMTLPPKFSHSTASCCNLHPI
ncbi:DNA (cytosine-5)-methyltransferase CMT2-like [Camellia sinensis]|uniref:DNA (cytosine-5)-methyltransferase CMT2-like n=1 Tax=Camellia sinensis TaxID=4442 RepID=UPI001036DD42|nr:DNA (cytosine-5)-methyltransferase CMT2-like [Camellia sinensis]